jgi:hypothetical protein
MTASDSALRSGTSQPRHRPVRPREMPAAVMTNAAMEAVFRFVTTARDSVPSHQRLNLHQFVASEVRAATLAMTVAAAIVPLSAMTAPGPVPSLDSWRRREDGFVTRERQWMSVESGAVKHWRREPTSVATYPPCFLRLQRGPIGKQRGLSSPRCPKISYDARKRGREGVPCGHDA